MTKCKTFKELCSGDIIYMSTELTPFTVLKINKWTETFAKEPIIDYFGDFLYNPHNFRKISIYKSSINKSSCIVKSYEYWSDFGWIVTTDFNLLKEWYSKQEFDISKFLEESYKYEQEI